MSNKFKKTMIVEDNEHTRFLVNAILTSMGFQVVEAADGKIAMDKLSEPDTLDGLQAIFLDVLMPNISGMDVLTWVKQNESLNDVPVIMLTTRDMAEDLIECYGMGADYYISKPFTKQQIQFGLDLILGGEKKTG